MHSTFWISQVRIEVTNHQQLILLGTPADGRKNFLYGLYAVGGDIITHAMPLLLPCHQLKAKNVWYVEAYNLQR